MQKLRKVLLVDDDKVNNYVNEELLKELGIAEQIHITTNGDEAINYLIDNCEGPQVICPELVIFDHQMPVMDGLEFIKALHAMDFINQKNLILLLLGVDSRQEHIEEYKKLGVHAFTQKPLSDKVVMETYHTYFAS